MTDDAGRDSGERLRCVLLINQRYKHQARSFLITRICHSLCYHCISHPKLTRSSQYILPQPTRCQALSTASSSFRRRDASTPRPPDATDQNPDRPRHTRHTDRFFIHSTCPEHPHHSPSPFPHSFLAQVTDPRRFITLGPATDSHFVTAHTHTPRIPHQYIVG